MPCTVQGESSLFLTVPTVREVYGEHIPVLLTEINGNVVFLKNSERIIFSAGVLAELKNMLALAREMKVELSAQLKLTHGVVSEISYPDDKNKIAVLTADLPSSQILNTSEYFSYPAAVCANLRHFFLTNDLSKGMTKELKSKFLKAYKIFFQYFSQYKASLRVYIPSIRKRVELNPGTLSEMNFNDLYSAMVNLQYIATEWIGCKNLDHYSFERNEIKDLGDEEVSNSTEIHIHNHPNGYACLPSAIYYKGKESGDIMIPGFFSGVKSGLILDTQDGDELFILYEPDATNKSIYHHLFREFWHGKQDIVEELRNVAMSGHLLIRGNM